jgi:hypothetical protein
MEFKTTTASSSRSVWASDVATLIYLAALTLIIHLLTAGRYRFHRDELATLDDARHLAWGTWPTTPLTPFFGRISLEFLGTSLAGFRYFAVLAAGASMFLTGLMGRELGGGRSAQLIAAVAATPFCLAAGSLLQYVAFEYLWWVLISYLFVRLCKSNDPHWWIGIGVSIGFGMPNTA